ncbi:MAG: hypothetical protein WCA85_25820 [Paraburkholderia sp.]|uniref:hypothetical protein n=1 Tax=Paraburkholderia sp. TaxID=1926495 RepID=UPI003C3FD4EF
MLLKVRESNPTTPAHEGPLFHFAFMGYTFTEARNQSGVPPLLSGRAGVSRFRESARTQSQRPISFGVV